jgi:parallel beta-helix repeat protein
MEKYLILLLLILIPIFSTAQPLSSNINSTPGWHTVINYKRIGNNLYVSYRDYEGVYNPPSYYVSSSTGSDSYDGLSEITPFASLTKVNTLNLSGVRKRVVFKCGDTFYGTIGVNYSGTSDANVTYDSYGTGAKPIIYGSAAITGWTKRKVASNIYVTKYTPGVGETDITQLFLDDEKMTIARYPNTGYFTITTEVTDSIITMSSMTSEATDYYKDATVLTNPDQFNMYMRTVRASTGNTIYLSRKVSQLTTGSGIVLMNKLEFLDAAGEWFYNTTTDSLYFWAPNSDDPDNYTVRGSTITNGISIVTKNYVTVKNIDIRQHKSNGISVTGSSNYIVISDNNITGQESTGIFAEGSGYHTYNQYLRNTIAYINGRGIYGYRNDNATVQDNTISHIALPEMLGLLGVTRSDGGDAMYMNGKNNLLKYNRIDSIGYRGIYWNGYEANSASEISYNYITNVGYLKGDGGGIYTGGRTTQGSVVKYNIVEGSYGLIGASKATRNFGDGIYLDEPSSSVTVEYNTVINCTGSGVKVHDGTSHTIRYNTIFDCRESFMVNDTVNSASSSFTFNKAITSNRLDSPVYEPRQLLTNYFNDYNLDGWAYNIYINGQTASGAAQDSVFKKVIAVSPFTYYYKFATWSSLVGTESGSSYIGTDLIAGEMQKVFYNVTKTNVTYSGQEAKDENGNSVTSFELTPFTSKYLRGTEAVINSFTIQ